MAFIGKILSYSRALFNKVTVSEVKVDPGGGANRTVRNFSPAGDDSHPLPDDYNISVATGQESVFASVGFLDPKNKPVSEAGEKRIYSRNASGDIVAAYHLKNDGSVSLLNEFGAWELRADGSTSIANTEGFMELMKDGTFSANGVTIDPDGLIVTPKGIDTPSAVIGGIEHNGHIHLVAGVPSGPAVPAGTT